MNTIRTNALCIIQHKNKILGVIGNDTKKGETFIRLIGGGVEFGEKSSTALHREFQEELGTTIYNEKLLSVIENIFEYNGMTGHEITFLYSAEIRDSRILDSEKIQILDSSTEKYAQWVDIQQIKDGQIKLYPKESLFFL